MFNIQILNNISSCGLSLLEGSKYQYSDTMPHPQGILVRSASMHNMEFPPSLLAVARAGAGTNNIPVELCSKKGIVVFNTPGANANAVKELVMAGLLLSQRKIVPAIEWVKTLKGSGDAVSSLIEKGKTEFVGPELAGKCLGVIGLGAIGRQVANMAVKLGMIVYGYDPFLSVDSAWELSHSVHHAKSLEEIYHASDLITLHLPLMPSTQGIINTSSIKMMKQGVRILNFARGELVHTANLLEALDEKYVTCYVTDFPTDEMLDHKGVIPIPHLGATTPESEENCARMAVSQLANFLENGVICNSVNFPDVFMERSTNTRIGIINQNIPNMITQISQVFSSLGVNIANLTNKSQKEYAYTLVDIDKVNVKNVVENLISPLESINGVVRTFLFEQ